MTGSPIHHMRGGDRLLQSLADFRYQLRQFLQYSEHAAARAGVQPQQHQLLLQVAGKPRETVATIAWAAERLGLQHHSVVELVDRSVREHLIERSKDPRDARCVILSLSKKGRGVLRQLSEDHACELRELGPRLVRSLKHIGSLKLRGANTSKTKRGS
ncbi:MAG: MarR family transcriptional regulator [Candidatus Acidiferrales bacterium]